MTEQREAQLVALRDRLNRMGEASGYWIDDRDVAVDTFPHRNSSEWNARRIRIRNRINARLTRHSARAWIA
jgi:hypothetical protein